MTYRIGMERGLRSAVFVFEGLLDQAALEALRQRIGTAPGPVRVVLRAGTEVSTECIAALRALPGVELVAESAFLSRWLSEGKR